MVCLDTSVAISFLEGDKKAVQKIVELEDSGAEIRISSITAHELLFGSYFYKPTEVALTKEFVNSVDVLEFDGECANISALLRSEAMRAGKSLGIFDSMIAGIVLAKRETLLTSDRGFAIINKLGVQLAGKPLKLDVVYV